MRILITGGSGFIGGTLIRRLLFNKNFQIFNIDKYGYASDHKGIEECLKKTNHKEYNFIKVNLIEKEKIKDLIFSIKPEIIMHLAAESHVDRSIQSPRAFIESNIIGTFNLLESAYEYYKNINEKIKTKFIFHHVSTDEVFGSLGKTGKFSETTAYDPRSPYSASKASSDHLVRAFYHTYGLPVLITNCSNNFGPWQFPEKLIPLVINKALNQENIPIYGNGSNIRDWLFVEDHIDALLICALNGNPGETYCIGGHGERTNKFVVEKICELMDKLKPISGGSYKDLIKFVKDRPGHDQRYAIDSSKLTNQLNWRPKFGFDEGLDKTVKWYIKNYDWCRNTLRKNI